MSREPVRVLGVDTSLRSTGVGVVESCGSKLRAVEFGCLRVPASIPMTACLRRIGEGIRDILERERPHAAAIEGIFYCKNARTALVLGQARGVVMATCAALDVPVFEYAPRRVKQAVVGYGAAEKEQVRAMIVKLLGLSADPQEDAGDALALAVCHLHSTAGHPALMPTPI